MGGDGTADAPRPVTPDAIAFAMTTHARIQRAFSFSRVLIGTASPLVRRGVKASAGAHVNRGKLRNAEARVALGAKCLSRMATGATRLTAPRLLRVQRQPVVGMNGIGTPRTIVALDTTTFAMAVGAYRALVSGNPAVADGPIASVLHIAKRPVRLERSLRIRRYHLIRGRRPVAKCASDVCAFRLVTSITCRHIGKCLIASG
jgi:hypothetical protein